jgi:hypothetical protein
VVAVPTGSAAQESDPPRTLFRRHADRYDAAAVRSWALSQGIEVSRTGGLPRFVYDLFEAELAVTPDGPATPA